MSEQFRSLVAQYIGIVAPSAVQEAADQEKAIVGIVSICGISYEQARERFAAYCATQPYSWRTCRARILAGNTEALAYLRGERDRPSS